MGGENKAIFKFIKDRVCKKINSWGGRSLSKAGKEVMIKSVLQSIPTYFMSLFLLPSSLEDEVESLTSGFWWGGSGATGRGMRWLAWDKLCIDKDRGGMGFRNLYVFNVALFGKQGWRLMHNPNSLVAQLCKSKYFPRCDLKYATKGNSPSFVWRSIHEARLVLVEGCRWMLVTVPISMPLVRDGWEIVVLSRRLIRIILIFSSCIGSIGGCLDDMEC